MGRKIVTDWRMAAASMLLVAIGLFRAVYDGDKDGYEMIIAGTGLLAARAALKGN